MIVNSARLASSCEQTGETRGREASTTEVIKTPLEALMAPPLDDRRERWSMPAQLTPPSGLDALRLGDTAAKLAGIEQGATPADIAGPALGTALTSALDSLNSVLNIGHQDAADQFRKQAGELAGALGADCVASALPQVGADSAKPDMPYKRDDSLYGMHDGKLDDDDVPDGGGDDGGQGTGRAGMDPTELHQWGESQTPPPSAPRGATDTSGGAPAPSSSNPSDNALNRAIGAWAAEHPKTAAAVGFVILSVGASISGTKKMTDPDAAQDPPPPTPEQIDAKLNGLKHPVSPDGDVGGSDQIDGAMPPRQTDGLDPTLVHVDSELGGEATGELSTKVTTAPIDHVPDWEPSPVASGAGPTGGSTSTDGESTLRP